MAGYTALALQTRVEAVSGLPDVASCRDSIARSLERVAGQVAASRAFIGPHVALVVLPEYFLTGYPMGESAESWRARGCLEPAGREYDALGAIAASNGVFLSGNLYETDAHFPELYFQTSFIANDAGDIVLRYRRLISQFGPTPYEVLDRYLDVYGADSLFPVVETELGRLAAVASEEIVFPEIARALALRGAEVLCHSSSEVASPVLTPKNVAKRARAYENHVYVVSANTAGVSGIDLPNESVDGASQIVDYEGRVLVEAAGGESMAAHTDIDVDALRAYRRRPGMFNVFSRQRLALFRVYADSEVCAPNSLLDDGGVVAPARDHFLSMQRQAIAQLLERGILV
ncbi:MAG: nitrilase [Gammaproteobacteria bacterium]|nr:nitrilase [Gammaproteobacteria bacterium]MXY57167.1 nitrilase [Gammaproteobacteria bacterium]MYC53479.1 nitrilase [Gammaproteobacteria bacterium]MYJ25601.1 nitrilase [Holophagales bacterium]